MLITYEFDIVKLSSWVKFVGAVKASEELSISKHTLRFILSKNYRPSKRIVLAILEKLKNFNDQTYFEEAKNQYAEKFIFDRDQFFNWVMAVGRVNASVKLGVTVKSIERYLKPDSPAPSKLVLNLLNIELNEFIKQSVETKETKTNLKQFLLEDLLKEINSRGFSVTLNIVNS